MRPNDGDARKPPPLGAASAVGGTRPNDHRSNNILLSASGSSAGPTGALSQVGSTPSSAGWTVPRRGPPNGRAAMAPGPLPPNACAPLSTSGRKVGLTPSSDGCTPPKRGWMPAVDGRPPSKGALIPSREVRPTSSGDRVSSNPHSLGRSCVNRLESRAPTVDAIWRPGGGGLNGAGMRSLLAILLFFAPAESAAACRRFSIWHYSFPQPCPIARPEAQAATAPPAPDIPLPDMTEITWGETGDGRLAQSECCAP